MKAGEKINVEAARCGNQVSASVQAIKRKTLVCLKIKSLWNLMIQLSAKYTTGIIAYILLQRKVN